MTRATPAFSIIIPLFNGERYIAATLDSLAQQTVHDFEMIAVDDGSTDNGLFVVAEHTVGARLLRQDRQGVALARNKGALEARGQWLAFLDQDDLSIVRAGKARFVLTTELKFAIEDEREVLRSHDPQLVTLPHVWLSRGTEVSALCGVNPVVDVSSSDKTRLLRTDDLHVGTVAMTTSFGVERDYLRLVGGWSPYAKAIDDWWLMANAARVEPTLFVDQPASFYRVHSHATSRATAFCYAYSTSLLALRFGGTSIDRRDALTQPAENSIARHLLADIVSSPECREDVSIRAFARNIAGLLWPDGSGRQMVRRAELRGRLPGLAIRLARTIRAGSA
jgi:glycosyltransferase involved in cell wall biosynthesis